MILAMILYHILVKFNTIINFYFVDRDVAWNYQFFLKLSSWTFSFISLIILCVILNSILWYQYGSLHKNSICTILMTWLILTTLVIKIRIRILYFLNYFIYWKLFCKYIMMVCGFCYKILLLCKIVRNLMKMIKNHSYFITNK